MTVDKSKKIWEQITEETWCQGTYGRDRYGCSNWGRDAAVQMCAAAWIKARYSDVDTIDLTTPDSEIILQKFADSNGLRRGFAPWNDSSTFAEVHAALKQADL